MNDLNITFEQQPATANGPSLAVRCDLLPAKHQCRIDEQPRIEAPSVWYVCTCTRHAYSRRRGLTRKHWEFKSLDAAKAAAVAYVRRKVAEARRQEPVRHGAGQYRKGEQRVWYVLLDSCPTQSWQPVATKKDAIRLLEKTPAWAVS